MWWYRGQIRTRTSTPVAVGWACKDREERPDVGMVREVQSAPHGHQWDVGRRGTR